MQKAISVLCAAVLLAAVTTSCAATAGTGGSAGSAASTPAPAAQTEAVTLTVYLEAPYTQEGVHYPVYEALKAYDEAHPEIELEFVSPVGGANDPAKREEQIHQLNTEIITGGGPDVFVMGTFRYTDSNLFPDVVKAMGNHAFLPLSAYAQAAGFQRDAYIQPALEAGQMDGEQYILPLSVSVPLFVGGKDAVDQSGFAAEAAAKNQAAFFEELYRTLEGNGAQVLYALSLTNLLQQPLIDYAAAEVCLDTEPVRQALETEKTFATSQLNFFDSYDPAQIQAMAAGTPLGTVEMSDGALSILRPFAAQGVKAFVQAVPNEDGGITAQISSYAMANANTAYPEQAAALLYYLMSAECQDAAAYPSTTEQLPVRVASLGNAQQSFHQFIVYDASHETVSAEDIAFRESVFGADLSEDMVQALQNACERVSAAHFHSVWEHALQLGQSETGDDLLTEAMNEYLYGDKPLDQLIEELTPRLQMYLDE